MRLDYAQQMSHPQDWRPRRLAVFIAMIAGMCGCATTPTSTVVRHCPDYGPSNTRQCFVQPESAPPGKARLYVFRPDFSEQRQQDRPLLTIDDSFGISLPLRSYSFVDLPMGHHTYRLTPGPADAAIWDLQGAFEISADGPFYLAVWNTDIAGEQSSDYAAYGKDLAVSTAIGVLTAALSGGFAFFPTPTMHSKSTGMTTEARMELIAADQALQFLRECELSPATSLRPDGSLEPPVSPP